MNDHPGTRTGRWCGHEGWYGNVREIEKIHQDLKERGLSPAGRALPEPVMQYPRRDPKFMRVTVRVKFANSTRKPTITTFRFLDRNDELWKLVDERAQHLFGPDIEVQIMTVWT